MHVNQLLIFRSIKKADIYLYENQHVMYKRGSVLRSQILRRIISKVIASLGLYFYCLSCHLALFRKKTYRLLPLQWHRFRRTSPALILIFTSKRRVDKRRNKSGQEKPDNENQSFLEVYFMIFLLLFFPALIKNSPC